MAIYRSSLAALSILVAAVACSPAVETDAPEPSPSSTARPSETVDWFPATATATLAPTLPASPTADFHPGLGELMLEDDFSNSADAWPSTQSDNTRVSVENERLNLYSNIPSALLLAPRNAPVFGDFYAHISANTSLCSGDDEYGMMLRVSSSGDHYRFALSCDGRAKVDRVLNGAVSNQVAWLQSPAIPRLAPSIVQLGVWASGSEIRFFVDDSWLFSVKDTVIYSGRVGTFIRARGEGALSVSFSDLIVLAVEE